MNILDAKNDIERYEEALESTPLGVREFLWSDAFKALIESIAKVLLLNEAQKNAVESVLFDITIGYLDEENARKILTEAEIATETQEKLFQIGNEYIVAPAATESEAVFEELKNEVAEENAVTTETKKIPSTDTDILRDIQERLRTSATIAPTKRDVSLDNKPNTPSQPRSIDPYREIPE